MLFEERLEAAERRRLEGNRLFQGGSYTDALGKYAMGLSYMGQDFMFQLEGAHEAKANAVRLPVLLNMAACHLQLADFQGAIETASQVTLLPHSSLQSNSIYCCCSRCPILGGLNIERGSCLQLTWGLWLRRRVLRRRCS